MPDRIVFPIFELPAADHEPIAIGLGGTFRLPRPAPVPPPEIADAGRIRLGGTFRL